MMKHKYKISSNGWVCIWSNPMQKWLPIFELTQAQLSVLRSVVGDIEG